MRVLVADVRSTAGQWRISDSPIGGALFGSPGAGPPHAFIGPAALSFNAAGGPPLPCAGTPTPPPPSPPAPSALLRPAPARPPPARPGTAGPRSTANHGRTGGDSP